MDLSISKYFSSLFGPTAKYIYIYIYMKVNMDKIRQYEGSRKKYNPNR